MKPSLREPRAFSNWLRRRVAELQRESASTKQLDRFAGHRFLRHRMNRRRPQRGGSDYDGTRGSATGESYRAPAR
jgi:hypothetical protein